MFTVGADIAEMRQKTFNRVFSSDFPVFGIEKCRKPLIAAVNGHAVGCFLITFLCCFGLLDLKKKLFC